MNAREYARHCLRTWNEHPPDRSLQRTNAALGLAGEMAEYLAEPSADELGDALYYLSVLRSLYGMPAGKAAITAPCEKPMQVAGTICEMVKKDAFHDDPADLQGIQYHTAELHEAMADMADGLGTTIKVVRRKNIEKLRERFPDGFDADQTGADRHGESFSGREASSE